MVETKIRQIVDQIGGLHYEFNDWTRANATIDYGSILIASLHSWTRRNSTLTDKKTRSQ